MKKLYRLWRDKTAFVCLALLALLLCSSLLAPFFWPHSPLEVHEDFLNRPPFWMEGGSLRFPLGTDDLGRDFLARLIYGGKLSFLAGGLVMLVSLVFGVFFGLLSGFYPRCDPWVMGAVDILMSFPGLILAIVFAALLGPGLLNASAAVSLACLPSMIRLTRSLTLREKGKSYVEAGRSFGARPARLLFYHILPNSLGEISAQSLLIFSEGVLSVAALSFLGLGAEPPLPEWGVMIADGRVYLESSPRLASLPGLCLLLLIFCVNILGERLRDLFDPKAFDFSLQPEGESF